MKMNWCVSIPHGNGQHTGKEEPWLILRAEGCSVKNCWLIGVLALLLCAHRKGRSKFYGPAV